MISATKKKAVKSAWKPIRLWFKRNFKHYFPHRYAKNLGLTLYGKPFLEAADIVTKLQAGNLLVANPAAAADFLGVKNYYRFKAYLRPYLVSPTAKDFAPGSNFSDAVELFRFDEELRSLVLNLTVTVEVELRHHIDRRLTKFTANPFWYLTRPVYNVYPSKTLNMIKHSFAGSTEEFSKHFSEKYHNGHGGPYHFMPPFWMASELTTLGQLTYLLKAFHKPFFAAKPDNVLDLLARDFGAYNIGTLAMWTEITRNLRNWCAHNSRLWNRHVATPPGVSRFLDKKITSTSSSEHRIYHSLAMLRVVHRTLGIPDNVKNNMLALFAKYPVADAQKSHMGFPISWHSDPIW